MWITEMWIFTKDRIYVENHLKMWKNWWITGPNAWIFCVRMEKKTVRKSFLRPGRERKRRFCVTGFWSGKRAESL